jgi:hypothetical protein
MKSAYLIPLILEVKNLVSVSGNLTSFRSKFIAVGDYKVVYVKYLYLIVQKSSLIGRGA